MANELIVVEKIDKDVLFIKEGVLDTVLKGIREQLDKFKPDVSTAAGRKEIASMSRKVSSSKTFLDQIRKDKIAKAKEEIDSANGLWKPARETLEQWRDETRQPLTDWEAAEEVKEQERIADVRQLISDMTDSYWILNGRGTVEQLSAVIAELEAIEIKPEVYFEFTADAYETRDTTLMRAKADLETKQRLDREEAERKAESERLAAEKKVQDEQAAKLKAQQDELAAAQKKIDDEKAVLEAEKRQEQERKDREQFEKEAKEQAERDAAETIRIAERDRVEKERLDAEEAERQKSLLPDREKLEGFAQFLVDGITYPTIESKSAGEIIADAAWALEKLSNSIFEKAQDM